MGVVREFVDLVGKLNFYQIVTECQQGLYFRCGKAIPKRRHLCEQEKKNAFKKENGLIEDMGRLKFLPFRRPKLPEEFTRSWVSGLPLHNSRSSKLLDHGLYFHIPIIDNIVIDSNQERILNLGSINILTTDGAPIPINVSCNLRYRIVDFYRAYTAVNDYEHSLKDHTLSILAEDSRGRTLKEWTEPQTIKDIENKVENDLRELVTEKWGLELLKVYITDNVPSQTSRLVLDGQPINLTHKADITSNTPPE